MLTFLPCVIAATGFGFLRAHGKAARNDALPRHALVSITSAAPVCDGGSVCFEFETGDESPLWLLLQNRGASKEITRTVLVSRTPGFEDYLALKAGSTQERQMLERLHELALRCAADQRTRNNLDLLNELIVSRRQPWPAEANWSFH